jgi:hypothetical protein
MINNLNNNSSNITFQLPPHDFFIIISFLEQNVYNLPLATRVALGCPTRICL